MIKSCRGGFSLIEFMIYLSAFALIISLSLHGIVIITQKALISGKKNQDVLQLLLAIDYLAFEVAQAPPNKNNWLKIEKNYCIWHSPVHKKDIGFCLINKKMVKITGTYSTLHNKWLSKVSNSLADNIDSCLFNCESKVIGQGEQIQYFSCTLATSAASVTQKIGLKNGYLI